MSADGRNRHTNREFDAELRSLRERLLLMAGWVEEMIANALRALVERDSQLARATIESDHHVNRAEMEADQLCLEILAKRQPMASDLRFVTLALKMVTDLERIADLAVNVCERAIDLNGQAPLVERVDLPRMAAIVQRMIGDAITAFVERDVEGARVVIATDDEVDELYDATFRRLLSLMIADAKTAQRAIWVQSIAKYLERMADHATNLAEQVIFMVRGLDIRHEGKLDGE